jgi:hypothetical protein
MHWQKIHTGHSGQIMIYDGQVKGLLACRQYLQGLLGAFAHRYFKGGFRIAQGALESEPVVFIVFDQ